MGKKVNNGEEKRSLQQFQENFKKGYPRCLRGEKKTQKKKKELNKGGMNHQGSPGKKTQTCLKEDET